MDEKTEELIALVAKNHGISLDKTDPIMVIPTLLRFLMDESQEKQREMLDEFKSELQSAQVQWDYAAKDKADRILNAALKANTAAMEQVLITGAKQTAEIIRKEVDDSLKKSRSQVNNARRVVFWNLAASVITLLAAAIACVAAFLR
ncbi:conjugal transfer protein TraM [Pantoea agglomerans]|uniref:conjugal transfer protein TraM n=1 Tax=Enterobacter agglomerans TaxID=549 RepID=UPI003C7CA633